MAELIIMSKKQKNKTAKIIEVVDFYFFCIIRKLLAKYMTF